MVTVSDQFTRAAARLSPEGPDVSDCLIGIAYLIRVVSSILLDAESF